MILLKSQVELLFEVEVWFVTLIIIEITIEFNRLIMLNYLVYFGSGLIGFDFAQYSAQYLMIAQTQKHSQSLLQLIIKSFAD